jgi:predicted nucleotidyltransferase
VVHPVVESKREEIAALCRELGVRRLDVFGSAVSDDFDVERSDVDVLVEVDPQHLTLANYFALKEGLERLLQRPVDVVDAGAVRNPYFKAQVLATRELLYAA